MLLEQSLPDRGWEGVMLEEQGRDRTYREIMILLSLCWELLKNSEKMNRYVILYLRGGCVYNEDKTV